MSTETVLKVCSGQCDQCLFSDNKIVSDERKAEVISDCLYLDKWFVCHKTDNVCCFGFWQKFKRDVLPLRVAVVFDCVEFVGNDHE